MRLVSLNMEGVCHLDRVLPFLDEMSPDAVCLLEAPQLFQHHLQQRGYHTTFAPMLVRERSQTSHTEGVLLASRSPHTATTHYYYRSPEAIEAYQGSEESVANPIILATITNEEGVFRIATTHVMVTKHGVPDEHQRTGIGNLLAYLTTQPAHVLCGDFNIPRGHNDQYERITAHYTDTVPTEYTSSLDRDLHRLGSDPHLTDPIFDTFMVDYVFTQPPFTAK